MKVALVLCPSWGIETPHLGIALLVAALRRQNHQVAVCDFNIQVHDKYKEKGLWKSEEDVHWEDSASISKFIDENNDLLNSFIDQVLAEDTQVIGFSVYNTTRRLSLELAKRIKQRDKNKIVVFGGQQCYPEAAAEWLVKDESVDMVVMGEGDETLPELVTKIENSGEPDFCPGVVFKRNGKIINCGMRSPITDLDRLPFPDFSDFLLSSYGNPFQLPILTSRGCPYGCVFCSTKLFWIKYRSMSGNRIFQEIKYQLKKYKNVHFFTFNDHVIDANIHSLSCFCDLVLAAKSKKGQDNIDWDRFKWRGAAIIRPELTYEFLQKMKESNCIDLEYGIESGSQIILDKMKKGVDIKVAERVIRDTYKAGISVRANFMFGFPGETEGDFQKTLDFLKRNKEVLREVHASETFCHIDPGTYMINHLDEFGISKEKLHPLYWESTDGKNIYPGRLKRHQDFCQLANSLNIPLSPGGHKIILHKDYFLEEFRRYYKETHPELEKKKQILISAGGSKEARLNIGNESNLTFNWILHYKCNYRCPYCLYYNHWRDLSSYDNAIPIENWIKSWHRIYEKYGEAFIELNGGEPFIYPSFTKLIKELSKEHLIKMKTNLSCSIESLTHLINEIKNPERLKITLTFHPLFTEFDSFVRKLTFLKEKGFTNGEVFYLAYPPQIKQVNYYRQKFRQKDICLSIQPFYGKYREISYPESYTETEKKILGDCLKELNKVKTAFNQSEGRLCDAGYRFAVIQPDGRVRRCDTLQADDLLGDFFTEDFKLLDKPFICKMATCPYSSKWLRNEG